MYFKSSDNYMKFIGIQKLRKHSERILYMSCKVSLQADYFGILSFQLQKIDEY